MEVERELYRIRVTEWEKRVWADCILTDQRLLIKWDSGGLQQYSLRSISAVWSEDLPKAYRKIFKGKPDPAVVMVQFVNETHLRLYSTSGQLATRIQRVLMPF
jgi:hypothetical protein